MDGGGTERRNGGDLGRVALVLQGGGALGAYQAGVFEALNEAGVEPDWVIGTSIGAINAALIAGNRPADRIEALRVFWGRMSRPPGGGGPLGRPLDALRIFSFGLPDFFAPNPLAFAGPMVPLGPERAGYYSTAPLRRTLEELIDFGAANAGAPRLTVGAANVATGEMRYFDSARERLGVEHVLASGALPPAFPAVRIDGALYWDGGVLSNTPVEAVFDDNPRRSGVVFAVHMWRPHGSEPATLWEVTNREKDLRYASRARNHVERQRQLHRLRRVIAALSRELPAEAAARPDLRALASWGCTTTMHVVRLLAPALPDEDHLKDIDFTAEGVAARWRAGLEETRRALAARPWAKPHDPIEGFVLHEFGVDAPAGAAVAP